MSCPKIYCVGDIHAKCEFINRIKQKCEPGSHVFFLGDIGFGFDEKTDYKIYKSLDSLAKYGVTVYLIRGNHDDPSYWATEFRPVFKSKKRQDLYKDTYDKIIYVKDNTFVQIGDKKLFCLGGGVSIDRCYRKLGKTYWDNEEMIFEEPTEEIDTVLSHVGPIPPRTKENPNSILATCLIMDQNLLSDLKREEETIHKLLSKNPKHWIFGHYHHSQVFNKESTKCRVLREGEIISITA